MNNKHVIESPVNEVTNEVGDGGETSLLVVLWLSDDMMVALHTEERGGRDRVDDRGGKEHRRKWWSWCDLREKHTIMNGIGAMVTIVKTMGVIGIIMLFFVTTTVGNVQVQRDNPCCNIVVKSCCGTGDVANIPTYGKVVGRKGTVGRNVPFVSNHP
ncbi:hypothetical protein L1887_17483 [Cichorium endivia]|nr:hypothetical protein L1887_17483 [Cichorium endivia]